MAEFIYNTSLSGFALAADSTKVYEAALASGAPVIAEGSVYTVIWEGKRYVCEATVGLEGALYLGDQGIDREVVSTGEPFLYRYNGDGTGRFRTFSTDSRHAIAICEGQGNPTNYLMYERTIAFEAGVEGVRHQSMSSVAFPVITVGNTYTVVWDGTYYTCMAKTSTVDTWGEVILLGNVSVNGEIEGEDTGEPFLYLFVTSASQGFIQTLSTAAEHTVSIYDGTLRESRYLLYNETLDFAQDDTATGSMYITQLAEDKVFSAKGGKKYLVVWDGTAYTCKAQENNGMILIGNASLRVDWFPDTGEPFCIVYVAIPGVCGIMTTSTAAQHTVSVYQFADQAGWLIKDKVLNSTLLIEADAETGTPAVYGSVAVSVDGGATWGNPHIEEEIEPVFSQMLIPNSPYVVIWDGVPYACVAYGGFAGEVVVTILGDTGTLGDGFPTGEPFGYSYMDFENAAEISAAFATTDTAESHTISIYAGEFKTIFENLSFYYTEDGIAYWGVVRINAKPLEKGHEYTVVINGTEYKRTANTFTLPDGSEIFGIGNPAALGGEDNGDPFAFGGMEMPSGTGMSGMQFMLLWMGETPLESCTVSLYEGDKPAASDGGGEIVWADPTDVYTYDKDGKAVLHEKRSTVTFDTPDGRYAVFKLSHIADSRS